MSNTKLSAKTRILNFLAKGKNTLSVAQAQARFKIENVTARIRELRDDGYPIYTNTKKQSNGSKVSVYRLGTPSKAMKLALSAKKRSRS